MDTVLGHKPSTQPSVVVDTLEDSQVQDAEDNELQQEPLLIWIILTPLLQVQPAPVLLMPVVM